MNNKLVYILYCAVWLVCGGLIMQGCTDEDATGATPDDGTRLRLSIADLKEVQVRGLAGAPTAEYKTEHYDIFVYRGTDPDAAPYYYSHREKCQSGGSEYVPGMIGDGSSSPIIDLGIVPQDGDRIYVFINCHWADPVGGDTPEGLPYGASDKLTLLRARADCGLSFSGYIEWKNGRDNLILMERLTAKVRVKITASSIGSKTPGALRLCNVPKYTFAVNHHGGLQYEETGEQIGVPFTYSEEVTSGWYDEEPGVDIPEYKCSAHTALSGGKDLDNRKFDSQRMAVILMLNEEKNGNTIPSYYRLDFLDDSALRQHCDVMRGNRYTFLITKIHSEGYPTLEEAICMPAGNLEYTVTVNNDWTENFEYNGQWQLNIDREVVGLLPNIVDPAPVAKVELQNNNAGEADFTKLTSRRASLVSLATGEPLDPAAFGGTVPIQLWCYNPMTGQTVKAPDNVADSSMLTGTSWVFGCTTDADFKVGGSLETCGLKIVMGNIVKYIQIYPLEYLSSTGMKELDKSDGGTANCYIVSPLGGKYSFDATVMGNGVKGITASGTFQRAENTYYLNPGNEANVTMTSLSAKLLWQDKKGLISQVAFHDGRVEFVVSDTGQAGNAVIAVYDTADPNDPTAMILWSWHIWCAPRPVDIPVKPEAGTELVAGEKYIFMDRNLGAEDSKEVGMYYQYGRKDPFVDYKTNGHEYIYDLLGRNRTDLLKKVSTPPGLYQTIRFPLTYCGTVSSGPERGAVWGSQRISPNEYSTDTKTIYDPCPPGYKVPDMRPFSILRNKYYMNGKYDSKENTPFVSFRTRPIELYFPNGGSYVNTTRYAYFRYWTTGGKWTEGRTVFFYTNLEPMDELGEHNMELETFLQLRCINENDEQP